MAHYEIDDRIPVGPSDDAASKALPRKNHDLEPAPARTHSKIASVVLLLLSVLIVDALEIGLPLALLAIFFGYRVSLRFGSTVLALNPYFLVPAFCFLCTLSPYFSGTARLRCAGYPGREIDNLDRDLRCYSTNSGCMVTTTELFYNSLYNGSLRLLIKTFGPMKGAYTGPYPTREEAFALMHQSSNWVPYEGLSAELQRYGVSKIDDSRPFGIVQDVSVESLEARLGCIVTIYQESVLLVGNKYGVCLIDRDTGQQFARLGFESLVAFQEWRAEQSQK